MQNLYKIYTKIIQLIFTEKVIIHLIPEKFVEKYVQNIYYLIRYEINKIIYNII